MKKPIFTGCGVALATPFKNGGVDDEALDRLLDRMLEGGIDALVPCGTTGEPATMSAAEWAHVIEKTVKRAQGRVPVIAGTGANNTLAVLERARIAKDLGADAQLCVTPYYNKTTQQGLIAHFTKIADETPLPVVLYNVPARTGLNLQPKTLKVLSAHENILGIKEAAGDILQAAEMMRLCGSDMPLYSGEDGVLAPLRTLGCLGVISVAANIAPRLMKKLACAPLDEAGALQLELSPLMRLLFCEVNPIPVKAALWMQGVCENEVRLPLVPMTEENARLLRAEMQRLEII